MNELDTSLTLLKRDKFKLLENLYRLNSSVISHTDKEKLFNLIQRRHMQQAQSTQQNIIKQQQLQQKESQQQQIIDHHYNISSNREGGENELDKEKERERINRFNSNFNKFDQFRLNMQGPTPDDKRRYYTPINLNKNGNKYKLFEFMFLKFINSSRNFYISRF